MRARAARLEGEQASWMLKAIPAWVGTRMEINCRTKGGNWNESMVCRHCSRRSFRRGHNYGRREGAAGAHHVADGFCIANADVNDATVAVDKLWVTAISCGTLVE